MAKSELFFGGVPTGPDVKKIRDRWPDTELRPGDKIPYSIVANLLEIGVKESRFRTVTNTWRRVVERESGLVIGVEAGSGFVVLDDSGKHGLAVSKIRQSAKAARRSIVVASFVEVKNLTEDEKKRHTNLQIRHAAIIGVLQVRKGNGQLPSLTDS